MSAEFSAFMAHYIEQNQAHFTALNDAVWEHPDTRFTETFSARSRLG
ncbi:hypothetical protein Q3V30_03625 [Erwinia pyri]|uniref:Uncharacterized protein n=1 Tax=Erwinia pyri TaxID=3062598 RepID=A0AA50DKJ5_9GAMM|nr:hypothetical protein [Erwinia sp. DE2]WLS79614.1 hypothetical protein Q3V30_03625 [Erwinia sp. DE2]